VIEEYTAILDSALSVSRNRKILGEFFTSLGKNSHGEGKPKFFEEWIFVETRKDTHGV
jgi:hypothetical protein